MRLPNFMSRKQESMISALIRVLEPQPVTGPWPYPWALGCSSAWGLGWLPGLWWGLTRGAGAWPGKRGALASWRVRWCRQLQVVSDTQVLTIKLQSRGLEQLMRKMQEQRSEVLQLLPLGTILSWVSL